MSLVIIPEIFNSPFSFSRSLTQVVPDEMIREIMEFSPSSFHNLSLTSRSIHERISELATDYALKRRRPGLLPLNAPPLTTMILSMDQSIFNMWGCDKTTNDKELLLCDAIRTGMSHEVTNIITHGVDLNATRTSLPEHNTNMRSTARFPIEQAVMFNRIPELRTLVSHGADLNPMCNIGRRWFVDGYTDLINCTSELRFSIPVPDEIPDIILDAHIQRRDFSPFFTRLWRSDKRVFVWFCRALSKVPYGTRSGYATDCGNRECGKWCRDAFLCNGLLLCDVCCTASINIEELTPDKYVERLWGGTWAFDATDDWSDDDLTVQYALDEPDFDDTSSVGTFDGEDFDVQEFFGNQEGSDDSNMDYLSIFSD